MAKYLFTASYTGKGVEGLIREGGSRRREAVEQMLQGLGGKLESFYYAFGECDVFAIIDVPDAITASAVSLTINSTGAVQVSTTPLITPEEIDEACKKSVTFRPPGANS